MSSRPEEHPKRASDERGGAVFVAEQVKQARKPLVSEAGHIAPCDALRRIIEATLQASTLRLGSAHSDDARRSGRRREGSLTARPPPHSELQIQ